MIWKNWLNESGVGIYSHSGPAEAQNWYKPTSFNCLMEQLDKPFCHVCREATTDRILYYVKSVEKILPTPGLRVVVRNQPESFELTLLLPEPNTLRVEWRLNDQVIKRNSAQVSLSNEQLTDKLATLNVSVFDTTTFIRSEEHRRNHTYSYFWTVEKADLSPPFSMSVSKRSICAGEAVTLSALNCGGTVSWSTGATTSSITVSPDKPTSYSAQCAAVGGLTKTASVELDVLPLPVASAANAGPYVAGQTLQLTAQGGGSYAWKGPNGFTAIEQNLVIPNAILSHAGSYTVVVTSANGCVSTAQTLVSISPLLAVEKLPSDAVSVFPNPTQGRVEIQTILDGDFNFMLFDALGHEVLKKSFRQSVDISTESLPKALYFYRVSNSRGTLNGKLVIN